MWLEEPIKFFGFVILSFQHQWIIVIVQRCNPIWDESRKILSFDGVFLSASILDLGVRVWSEIPNVLLVNGSRMYSFNRGSLIMILLI